MQALNFYYLLLKYCQIVFTGVLSLHFFAKTHYSLYRPTTSVGDTDSVEESAPGNSPALLEINIARTLLYVYLYYMYILLYVAPTLLYC